MTSVRDLLAIKGNAVWSTTPESSVYQALQMMAEKDVGALVVLEGGKIAGMFTERDYARKLVLHGKFSRDTQVRDVMTEAVVTVGPKQTIAECMRIMTSKRFRHLPVVDEGSMIGLISIGDVVRSIITDQQATIGQLEDYIGGRR
jgi:CBS domain-containing protein